ncbi:hypothetical protein BDN67DRAFT_986127, partial [Paxillus ammoniavirescens]
DDIESFLHVLVWASIKYVPTTDSYSAAERACDLRRIFDVIDFVEDGAAIGGTSKADVLGGALASLQTAARFRYSPFKSRYIAKLPTEEERVLVEREGDSLETQIRRLTVKKYDVDMTFLKTSEWFIETLDKALQTEGWPSDDKAQKGLALDTQTSCLYTVAQDHASLASYLAARVNVRIRKVWWVQGP